MFDVIDVEYKVYGSEYHIRDTLKNVDESYSVVGFDIEARSVYSKVERKKAESLIGKASPQFYEVVANSSGLSHPSIQRTTHIVIGLSKSKSVVFVVDDRLAQIVFEWAVTTKVKLIFHNAPFDVKTIYFHTGKFPKDMEDTALISKVLLNDADSYLAKVGLKVLMKNYYIGSWALEVDYEVADLYDEKFIRYTAIDGCATIYLWKLLLDKHPSLLLTPKVVNPIDLLPIDHPSSSIPYIGDETYFYRNVVKLLIPDIIKVMLNGVPIDMDKVSELEYTVDTLLESVRTTINKNPLIQEYQLFAHGRVKEKMVVLYEGKKRTVDYYIKPYSHKSIVHRTYVVNSYLNMNGYENFTNTKWTIALLKKLQLTLNNDFLYAVINNELTEADTVVGMKQLAEEKLFIFNKSVDKTLSVKSSLKLMPEFNLGSSDQKGAFLKWCKIKPYVVSATTGKASWQRNHIERLLAEVQNEGGNLPIVLQAMIDSSFGSIIKSNFVPAFKKFTIQGTLYGTFKLFGAKTFRLTSKAPNMLNAPSTGSIYAKPLKKCFTAPEGKLILTADYSALESRVIANLSKDVNAIQVFTDRIDSHSLNTLGFSMDGVPEDIQLLFDELDDTTRGYYVEDLGGAYLEYSRESTPTNTEITSVQLLKGITDIIHRNFGNVRQDSKDKTFKLNYGGHPDIEKGGSITQDIYDRYHNVLYKGINDFRKEIASTTTTRGYNHLGLGCVMYSSKVFKHIRTLFNGSSQFWSILTLLTINKMHSLIEEAGYEDDIKCISSIYDSIYYTVTDDPKIVKWLNDMLIKVMVKDFMKNQPISNTAVSELGTNWSHLLQLPNESSVEEVEIIINSLKV